MEFEENFMIFLKLIFKGNSIFFLLKSVREIIDFIGNEFPI